MAIPRQYAIYLVLLAALGLCAFSLTSCKALRAQSPETSVTEENTAPERATHATDRADDPWADPGGGSKKKPAAADKAASPPIAPTSDQQAEPADKPGAVGDAAPPDAARTNPPSAQAKKTPVESPLAETPKKLPSPAPAAAEHQAPAAMEHQAPAAMEHQAPAAMEHQAPAATPDSRTPERDKAGKADAPPVAGQKTAAVPEKTPDAEASALAAAEEAQLEASGLHQAQILEPGQRAAFADLLKKKLNKKKSAHVPVLTEEEKSAIGPYEEQYAFLRSLAENEALLKEFTPAESFEAMLVGDAGNSENYLKVLEESRRVRRLQTGLANFYRSTVGKREALKQPHKLRPVFDEAFRKKVLTPVEQLLKIAPYIEEELRHLASASLIYANEPANEQKAGLLKEYLRRYREVSEDGNKIIREVRGGE